MTDVFRYVRYRRDRRHLSFHTCIIYVYTQFMCILCIYIYIYTYVSIRVYRVYIIYVPPTRCGYDDDATRNIPPAAAALFLFFFFIVAAPPASWSPERILSPPPPYKRKTGDTVFRRRSPTEMCNNTRLPDLPDIGETRRPRTEWKSRYPNVIRRAVIISYIYP